MHWPTPAGRSSLPAVSSPLLVIVASATPRPAIHPNHDYGTINKLLISHSITETIGIGYNLGYNYYGIGDGDANYSLAIGIVITDKVSLYAEPYGEFVEFEEHISNFDAGVTYLLKDNFQLDYSFGLGLNNDMNYMSIGFSWNVANSKN